MLWIVKLPDGTYSGPPSQAGARRAAYQWSEEGKDLAQEHADKVGGTVVSWNAGE